MRTFHPPMPPRRPHPVGAKQLPPSTTCVSQWVQLLRLYCKGLKNLLGKMGRVASTTRPVDLATSLVRCAGAVIVERGSDIGLCREAERDPEDTGVLLGAEEVDA